MMMTVVKLLKNRVRRVRRNTLSSTRTRDSYGRPDFKFLNIRSKCGIMQFTKNSIMLSLMTSSNTGQTEVSMTPR